jgi:EAL domain-containing protein (putative c-di-GMP-specific phosphodiesterase class I)
MHGTGHTNKNAYAILIGVNKYRDKQNLSPLRYAEKDSRDLRHVLSDPLIGVFPRNNTKLLTGAAATTRGIREALYTHVVADRRPDDLVLVYFAGHGFRAGERQLAYLASWDASIKELLRNPDHGLRMDRIHDDIFLQSPARFVLFVLDCCHSGALTPTSNRDLSTPPPGDLIDKGLFSNADGRVAFVSCPPDGFARESNELRNGLFTYHVIRGLKGAAADQETGQVTVDGLMATVRNQMPPDQTPGTYGKWYRRTVIGNPGTGPQFKPVRSGLTLGEHRLASARSLTNPLDPCVEFVRTLMKRISQECHKPGKDLDVRLLNAIGRACGADYVFALRFDGESWIIKSHSGPLNNASENGRGFLDVVSQVLASVDRKIPDRLFSISELYLSEDKRRARAAFVVIPLTQDTAREFMVVYGLDPASPFLGEAFALVLDSVYTSTRGLNSVEPLTIESSILDALRTRFGLLPLEAYNHRFDIFRDRLRTIDVSFEPILYLDPGNLHICGWEALARDPKSKRSPTDLFKAAELWGRRFVTELDIHCIRVATKCYRRALNEARMRRPYEVQELSVNVYPTSVVRTSYLAALTEALAEHSLQPQKLILEISEKTSDPDDVADIREFKQHLIQIVKDLRVNFALDNFGAGYASVSRLVALNPAHVKIDRRMLHYELCEHAIRFVLEVVGHGRLNSPKVIVEGFDTDSLLTMEQLYKIGIRYLQGYQVGRASNRLNRLDKEVQQHLVSLLTPPKGRAAHAP